MAYIHSFFHTPSKEELHAPLYLTWAGYRKCAPTHCIGPRVLPTFKAVLVVRGSGFFMQGNRAMVVREGDMFFLFPQVKHHYYANQDDPWELKWVAFNGTSCEEIIRSLVVSPEQPILHNVLTRRLLHTIDGVIDGMEQESPFVFAAIGNLYLFFDEILRIRQTEASLPVADRSEDELMERVLTFIALNYANELNVDVVCNHINYSRSYFSHLFKQRTGKSLPQYINALRIERAKQMLRTSDLRISEIASSIGYSDPFYFSRIFKEITGVSPQNYVREGGGEYGDAPEKKVASWPT